MLYTNNGMNNENKTIHDFNFSLICEYFSSMERQGHGSPEMILKALNFIDNLATNLASQILVAVQEDRP